VTFFTGGFVVIFLMLLFELVAMYRRQRISFYFLPLGQFSVIYDVLPVSYLQEVLVLVAELSGSLTVRGLRPRRPPHRDASCTGEWAIIRTSLSVFVEGYLSDLILV